MNNKIFLYFGSFDPIHRGHEEIIKHVFKKENADTLIIGLTNKNKRKPNLIDIHMRIHMIKLCQIYQKYSNNIIIKNTTIYKEVANLIKKNNITLCIICGDDCSFYIERLALANDKIQWHFTRRNNIIINPNIHYIENESFYYQKFVSSSYIKENILTKVEYLSINVLRYIFQNNLYNSINALYNGKIKKINEGKSNSIVYEIINEHEKIYVKIFQTTKEYITSINSYTFLKNNNFHVVDIINSIENILYVMKAAATQDENLLNVIISNINNNIYMYNLGQKFATELLKFTTIHRKKFDPNNTKDVNELSTSIQYLKLNKIQENQLISTIEYTYYSISDPNIKNFFIHDNCFIFIDYDCFRFNNTPINLIESDYIRLKFSCSMIEKEKNINLSYFISGIDDTYRNSNIINYDIRCKAFENFWFKKLFTFKVYQE